MVTEDQIRVCSQHIQERFVKISIMDKNNNILADIAGKAIDGEIDIDNSSNNQRMCNNLKLISDKTLLPNEESLIWTNNKFQLSVGIRDLLKSDDDPNNIVWFNQGVFLFKSTETSYSSTEKSLTLVGLDKMANLDGDLGGSFENDIKIENSGVGITEAVRHIVTDLGGEKNVLLDDVVDDNGKILFLPYTLNASAGSSMYDSIKELVNLYKYYYFYYDINGYFVLRHLKLLLNSPIDYDFRNLDYTISDQVENDYTYIKNYVKIIGVALEPTVTTIDSESTENPTPVNNSTSVKILFNKPIYNSSHNRIADKTDVITYFTYNGTISNYTKAIYSDADWSVTFTITGENGKIIKPNSNVIYDSAQMGFDDGGIVYSLKDEKWSKLLSASVITDGINNTVQFSLSFNKPLYDKNGNQLNNNTDVKNSFTYSNGDSSNFLSAIYTYDTYFWNIKLTFAQAVNNAVIEINKDGLTNVNSLYDSSGTIYQPENYIMDGDTWSKVIDTPLPSYQISAEAKNTDSTSPYAISKIGKRSYVPSANEKIYNISQAKMEANFQLQTHNNLNQTLTLVCLPQFYMDVNTIIYLYNPDIGINGKYRLDKLSYGLKCDSKATLTLTKIYM